MATQPRRSSPAHTLLACRAGRPRDAACAAATDSLRRPHCVAVERSSRAAGEHPGDHLGHLGLVVDDVLVAEPQQRVAEHGQRVGPATVLAVARSVAVVLEAVGLEDEPAVDARRSTRPTPSIQTCGTTSPSRPATSRRQDSMGDSARPSVSATTARSAAAPLPRASRGRRPEARLVQPDAQRGVADHQGLAERQLARAVEHGAQQRGGRGPARPRRRDRAGGPARRSSRAWPQVRGTTTWTPCWNRTGSPRLVAAERAGEHAAELDGRTQRRRSRVRRA